MEKRVQKRKAIVVLPRLYRRSTRIWRASLLLAAIGSAVVSACSLQAENPARSPEPMQAKAPEGELRRRAMFGAQLAPVTREVRDRQKLEGNDGVLLEKIFPETSAAAGDFKAGDVVVAIGRVKVTGVPMFLQKIEEARAGDVVTLDVVRDGVTLEKQVTLKEMPREKGGV